MSTELLHFYYSPSRKQNPWMELSFSDVFGLVTWRDQLGFSHRSPRIEDLRKAHSVVTFMVAAACKPPDFCPWNSKWLNLTILKLRVPVVPVDTIILESAVPVQVKTKMRMAQNISESVIRRDTR